MSNVPKVSVVIPVYNSQDYVSEAIDSILAQTFTDFELLLIDDASTDGSPEIMRSYRDPRIRLVRNEPNVGVPKTHNKGIELACGTYIAMLDHDDYSDPERLAKQVDFLDRNRDHAVVGTWGELIDETGRALGKTKKFPVSPDDVRSHLLFKNCILHPSIMARKAVLEDYRYSERFAICDDFDLFVRIANKHKLSNLPNVLVRHRRHTRSTSNRQAHFKKDEKLEIFAAQLTDLGVTFTDNDLERHLILGQLKSLGFTPDGNYLDWAESWLGKLAGANRRALRYSEVPFSHVLGEMWLTACWHASARASWSVWARCFRSPLSRGAWGTLSRNLLT